MARSGGTFRCRARAAWPMISQFLRTDKTETMTQASFATHEVFNQSPPFEDVDLYALDQPLVDAVVANGGADAADELTKFGRQWGSAAMAAHGRIANENTPKLRSFDARGFRR